jgi:hypothetical protein
MAAKWMLGVGIMVVVLSANADLASGTPLVEGFETGIGGWQPYGGASTITRVASGTNGIVSSSGMYHAEIFMDGDAQPTATADGGAYVNPGAGTLLYPGFGTAVCSVDVYVDPAVGAVGEKWSMQVALNFYNAANAITATKTFSFVCNKTAPGEWTLGRNSGTPLPISITEAGWYTMSTEWTETDNGIVDYNFLHHGSVQYEVGSGVNVLNQTADHYATRYMWLFGGDNISKTVAIDNSSFEIVPEPATMALLGVGLVGLLRRRKAQKQAK